MDLLSLATSIDVKGLVGGLAGGVHGGAQFELRIGPFAGHDLEVVSFQASETLSAPYEYDIVFASSVPFDVLESGVFGSAAALSVQTVHQPRVIQGIAASFESVGAAAHDLTTDVRHYATRIVPRLWLLNHNRKYRVFQNRTAIDVARVVLGEAGITPTFRLSRADYGEIPFLYQRGETDLEFLNHILAVAGIFYYFEHASGWLSDLVPGATGALAMASGAGALGAASLSVTGGIGGVASGLTGGLQSAAGVIGDVGSEFGLTTTLVLCDAARHTYGLHDGSAAAAIGASAAGALGSAVGALGGALGGVVGDVVGAVASIADAALVDALTYDAAGDAGVGSERVFRFRSRAEIRPKQITLRDWSVPDATAARRAYRTAPVSVDLVHGAAALVDVVMHHGKLSGALATSVAIDALPIMTSEVSVAEYQRAAAPLGTNDSFAERALSQLRADRVTASGESDCRRLAPGYRFKLAGHPVDAVNTEYVVTAVHCAGRSPDHVTESGEHVYRNTFTCVPASSDPRPKKPEPRAPLGPETAAVVGPVHDDVHCDSAGRIQVRFHWADAGTADGTCWVHWQEPWAGNGYGTRHLPRVGSEVIVQFFQQSGASPIATGQLYDRVNAAPFTPGEELRVGVRARAGEISVDDTFGSERVFVRAERELRIEAAAAAAFSVGDDLDDSVGGDRHESTGGSASYGFTKSVSASFGGSLDRTIADDCSTMIAGNLSEEVGGAVSRRVSGPVTHAMEDRCLSIFQDDVVERFLGHRTLIVGSPDERRSLAIHVEGLARCSFREGEIVIHDALTLTCGETRIRISPEGLTVSSPKLVFDGGEVKLSAKTVAAAATDSLSLQAKTFAAHGSGGAVVLDEDATIKGGKVKLNPPGQDSAAVDAAAAKKKPTRVVLKDAKGKPLANTRVVVRVGGEGGAVRVVVLDADGALEVDGSEPLDVMFPDVPDAHAS